LVWRKPEDLELVAECESLPEGEIVRGLLQSGGIASTVMAVTDSTILFTQRSVFGQSARRAPYKVLVRPEDAEAARGLLAAPAEESGDDG
jgi:hypothetical protein